MERTERVVAPPEGGYGWIIVLGTIVINSSLTPLLQCFGLIYESKFQALGVTATETSLLLHLHTTVMCVLGLLCGPLLKKYNFRQVSLCGCFLVCVGVTGSAFAESYGQLIFTVCFLIGTGQGVLLPSSALATNSYFKKRLTLAMSYSVTGVGLLPIAMPQICNYLLDLYGIAGTVLLLAGFSYHAFAGALLLRPLKALKRGQGQTAKEEENVDKETGDEPNHFEGNSQENSAFLSVYNETTVVEDKPSRCEEFLALFNAELFKERVIVVILIGMGVSYVAELNFTLMTPFVLTELASFSRTDVALAISIQAVADILGRLIIPIVSHSKGWSPKIMYAVSLTGSSVGRTVLAVFCDTRYLVLSCFVLLGLCKGAKAVYQSLILPKYVPLEKLPSAMGFLMIVNGTLSLLIGPVIGAVHDFTNSYAYALYTATILSFTCVIIWTLDACATRLRGSVNSAGNV